MIVQYLFIEARAEQSDAEDFFVSHILVNLHNATVVARLLSTHVTEFGTKFINPLTTLRSLLPAGYSLTPIIDDVFYFCVHCAISVRCRCRKTRQTLLRAISGSSTKDTSTEEGNSRFCYYTAFVISSIKLISILQDVAPGSQNFCQIYIF